MDERAKKIQKIITDVYDSLDSHLKWTYQNGCKKCGDSRKFHQKCVKEYADIIKNVTDLY